MSFLNEKYNMLYINMLFLFNESFSKNREIRKIEVWLCVSLVRRISGVSVFRISKETRR